jgi:hypothetical protein
MMPNLPPERDTWPPLRGHHYGRNLPGFQDASDDRPAMGMLSVGRGWAGQRLPQWGR